MNRLARGEGRERKTAPCYFKNLLVSVLGNVKLEEVGVTKQVGDFVLKGAGLGDRVLDGHFVFSGSGCSVFLKPNMLSIFDPVHNYFRS